MYQNTAAYFADGSVMVIKSGYDIYFYPFAKDFDKENLSHVDDAGSYSQDPAQERNFLLLPLNQIQMQK